MTDRAQPGAIDSLIRNDELRQIFGRFSDGFIVPGNDPTPAAQRRGDINETVLNSFTLTTASGSSLDVTVAPGEGFVGGWFCRDTDTVVTLPANATADIVVGFDDRAIFDPNTDADRDEADSVIVDLERNVDNTLPATVAHRVTTDGSGVTSSERISRVTTTPLSFRRVTDVTTFNESAVTVTETDGEFVNEEFQIRGATATLSAPKNVGTSGVFAKRQAGVSIGDNGSKLYSANFISDEIQQFDLSTAFDITSVNGPTAVIASQGDQPAAVEIMQSGNRLFELDDDTDTIHEYTFGAAFDLTTASPTGVTEQVTSSSTANVSGLTVGPDGEHMFVDNNDQIVEYEFGTTFDLSTATQTGATFTIPAPFNFLEALAVSQDGETVIIDGTSTDETVELSLSTPFDISTASVTRSVSSPSGGNPDRGVDLADGDTELFIMYRGAADQLNLEAKSATVSVAFDRPGSVSQYDAVKVNARDPSGAGTITADVIDGQANTLRADVPIGRGVPISDIRPSTDADINVSLTRGNTGDQSPRVSSITRSLFR